jgi:para-nitrobenzyl esterase
MDVINLDTGLISGIEATEKGQKINIFKGIPYAAPPTDNQRWKPPEPPTPWAGVRECTKYSIQAAQYRDIHASGNMQNILSSEDCLYLNVMTPAGKATDKLPVMVWLHGGGLRYGNGNSPFCDNAGLPLHGVVQVNLNHRLGVMGLFAHPLLTKESSRNVSGNYMFLDMIAALEWVQRNISAFGGDPNNVTIFGESGGGLKVAALMASPLAHGLFHRAIIESGGREFDTLPLKEVEVFGEKFFHKLGIDCKDDPLAAARELPWQTIIDSDQELNVELGPKYAFMGPWHIVHDGWFLPDTLVNMFQTGRRNQVPYLVVANKGELTGPGFLIADTMIRDYLRLLNGPSSADARGFAAIFDQVPEGRKRAGAVAAHGTELYYVFGALDNVSTWANSAGGQSTSVGKAAVPELSDSDRAVAENMQTIWTHFARTGNPTVKGLIDWPAWESKTDQYLLITDPLQIKQGFSELTKIVPDRSQQVM